MYEAVATKTVLLEITNACNLECVHCFNSFDRHTKEKPIFMSIENVETVVKKCFEYGLLKLYISGGEPLLHPKISDIIAICGKYPNVLFTITTNGLLINKALIDEMEKYSNICLQLSIDGATESVYEKQRGAGTYHRFRDALELIIKSKIRYKTARTCVTAINIDEVAEIFRFCASNDIIPSFLFADRLGNAAKNWSCLSLNLSQKLRVLNTIIELNKEFAADVSTPDPVSSCNYTDKFEVKAFLVKYTGDVAPCQYYYCDSIGNVFRDSIEEILNYDNLKRYYEVAEKRKQNLSLSPKCQKCEIHGICSYGCMGLAALNGDEMGYDGLCSYRILTCAMYCSKLIDLPKSRKNKTNNEIINEV